MLFVNLGRFNEETRKEEIVGIKGQGIPTEDLRAMITDATQCPELIGTVLIDVTFPCIYRLDIVIVFLLHRCA